MIVIKVKEDIYCCLTSLMRRYQNGVAWYFLLEFDSILTHEHEKKMFFEVKLFKLF